LSSKAKDNYLKRVQQALQPKPQSNVNPQAVLDNLLQKAKQKKIGM